jgi:DNA-directed RNA polymerase specialized sigma24 family protein
MADHWKEKERYLTGLITDAARRRLGCAEEARDCVLIFLEKALEMPEAQDWPFSTEAAATLAVVAERCAKTEAQRLWRLRRREILDIDVVCRSPLGSAPEPVSRAIGPEQCAILRCIVQLIAIAVKQLPWCYYALFVEIFVKHKTPTELARETGRSQQSVDRRAKRLKAAIRRILAGTGLTEPEIAELLNHLERCRDCSILDRARVLNAGYT